MLRQQGKNVSRAMLKGLEKRKHNLEAKLEMVEQELMAWVGKPQITRTGDGGTGVDGMGGEA